MKFLTRWELIKATLSIRTLLLQVQEYFSGSRRPTNKENPVENVGSGRSIDQNVIKNNYWV